MTEFGLKRRRTEGCRDVVQWAECRDGLLHPNIQGAHAPGAGASQNPRCGRREAQRHFSQAVTPKLPTTLPKADGQQEHPTEAPLHRSSHLVRPVNHRSLEKEHGTLGLGGIEGVGPVGVTEVWIRRDKEQRRESWRRQTGLRGVIWRRTGRETNGGQLALKEGNGDVGCKREGRINQQGGGKKGGR